MDFFNWNFIVGFCGVAGVVSAGSAAKLVRVFALGTPLLITEVSIQVLLTAILKSFHVKAPFRMSSVVCGEEIRSAVYVLAEDIIAVDAQQGKTYRRQLENRYLASATVQQLCHEMDWFWGVTGTIVGGGIIASVFAIPSANVGFTLGKFLQRRLKSLLIW